MMGPKQGHGDPRSHCGYTQGGNISGSFCVNLDPLSLMGKKLWYILRLYLPPRGVDPEAIYSNYCGTDAASSKKKFYLQLV